MSWSLRRSSARLRARDSARMFASATNVLVGAAVVVGAASLYLTLRKPSSTGGPASARIELRVTPTSASVGGSF